MEISKEIIRGSLRLIILEILNESEQYGYSLSQEIRLRSKNKLKAGEGTLYPALYKLENEKYIRSRWDDNFSPKRKYYSITAKGKKLLKDEKSNWNSFLEVMKPYLSINTK